MAYATDTKVPVEQTRNEIEKTLQKYGASGFCYGSESTHAVVGFTYDKRFYRINLPIPQVSNRSPDANKIAKQVRSRWRALLLVIKAKLEAVECGISSIENEFLANTMMSDGALLGDRIREQIAQEYLSGKPRPLLLGASGASK